jgi:hypothetical protein
MGRNIENENYIVSQRSVSAGENVLGKPLRLYLVAYHDGCLTGDGLASRLMQSYLHNRATAYETRRQGLYAASEFREKEDNENNYFSFLVEEGSDNVIAGSRVTRALDQRDLQFEKNFGSNALNNALDDIQKNTTKQLIFSEPGGLFTAPDLQHKGLAKIANDYLNEHDPSKSDIYIIDMFPELAHKYINWAKERGMKQIYLLPENTDKQNKGYVLIRSPHGKEDLPLEMYFEKHHVEYVDALSAKPGNIVKLKAVIGNATEHQKVAG